MNSEFKNISLDDLKLDSTNPRLPVSLHNKPEDKIIDYMLLEASTLELMQAIGENNFFQGEQLLVVKDGTTKYLVVEGNRRLTALKLLKNKDLAKVQKTKVEQVYNEAKFRPESIPCLVFPKKDDILKYLGYRHITGVKAWKLLEKARYLYLLKQSTFPNMDLHDACRELAKIIGSRKDYVERLIIGYEIYRQIEDHAFYKIRDLDDTTFFFNYIADSLNKRNIENFLGVDLAADDPVKTLNAGNLRKWTKWLFEKNDQNKTRLIGDSEQLTMLNNVLGNKEALEAFDVKGLDIYRANELTGDIDIKFQNAIKKSTQYLETADSLVHKVREFYPDVNDDLSMLRKLAKKIEQTMEGMEDES
jgi:hypothetical protein